MKQPTLPTASRSAVIPCLAWALTAAAYLPAAPLAPPIVQSTGSALRVDWAPNSQLFVSDDLVNWTLAPVPATQQRATMAIDKPNKFFRVVQNGQVSDAAGFSLPVHPPITEIALPSVTIDGFSPIEVSFETPPGSPTIPMSIGGSVKIFRDDGTSGDKVAGDGKFTAALFLSGVEVNELNTFLNGLPPGTVQPMFRGREWIGNVPVAPISLNGLPPGQPYIIRGGFIGGATGAPSKTLGGPPSVRSTGGAVGIAGAPGGAAGAGPVVVSPLTVGSWDKSLMITDLTVVNDPTRTFDPCSVQGQPGMGTPMGPWTFGKLMTNMTPTGVDPRDFVRRWLESWVVNQTINNDVVANRLASIQTSIITPWEIASGVGPGGPLDLAKAPFRLCAIVNRVDLRQTNGSPYGGGTVKDDPCNPICEAGEARFVFCALGPVFHTTPAGGTGTGGAGGYNQTSCELPFTVILEYCVPRKGCEQIKAWAQQWLALESIPFGPAYNAALQAITDQFTLPGQGTSGPQRSAISQIRSNEILIGPWEMREWRIFNNDSDAGMLREVTVKQTPAWVHNGQNEVQTFLQAAANVGQFTTPGVTVPLRWMGQAFLGGASPMPNFRGFPTYWDGPLPVGSSALAMDDRHSFSLNTCSGCHHGETGNFKSNPAGNLSEFTHVSERPMFAPSTLSGFLTGITTGAPDPALTGAPNENWNKSFADLVRRHVDLVMVAKQPCFFRIFDTALANIH
jgi:hypothetical protein